MRTLRNWWKTIAHMRPFYTFQMFCFMTISWKLQHPKMPSIGFFSRNCYRTNIFQSFCIMFKVIASDHKPILGMEKEIFFAIWAIPYQPFDFDCFLLSSSFLRSFHNRDEVDVVMNYIKKLLTPGNPYSKKPIKESDIGVVAPYRLQCKFLVGACRQNNFNDITVGTAEIFQGQERPVMIISTVRTDMKLGFVNDARVRCH